MPLNFDYSSSPTRYNISQKIVTSQYYPANYDLNTIQTASLCLLRLHVLICRKVNTSWAVPTSCARRAASCLFLVSYATSYTVISSLLETWKYSGFPSRCTTKRRTFSTDSVFVDYISLAKTVWTTDMPISEFIFHLKLYQILYRTSVLTLVLIGAPTKTSNSILVYEILSKAPVTVMSL